MSRTKRRVSFEWALIQGQTDTETTAHELGALLQGYYCSIYKYVYVCICMSTYCKSGPVIHIENSVRLSICKESTDDSMLFRTFYIMKINVSSIILIYSFLLLPGLLCHVNVIPLNPTAGYAGKPTSKVREKMLLIFVL